MIRTATSLAALALASSAAAGCVFAVGLALSAAGCSASPRPLEPEVAAESTLAGAGVDGSVRGPSAGGPSAGGPSERGPSDGGGRDGGGRDGGGSDGGGSDGGRGAVSGGAAVDPGAAIAAALAQAQGPDAVALAFLDALHRGDAEAAASLFEDPLRRVTATYPLAQAWAQITDSGGEFVAIEAVEHERGADGDAVHLVARFESGRLDVRLVVGAEGGITALAFGVPDPPPYEPPAYVASERVTAVDVQIGTQRLGGELTLPRGASGQVPAVVIVAGSGPQDRDGSIGPSRPLRDLAWGLASRGIAAVRWDKRSMALRDDKDEAAIEALSLKEDSVDDALAAARLLRQLPGVDARRVYVLGHSLGGLAAARVAAADPRIAGVVLLATPTRPLEDLLLEQLHYLGMVDGRMSPHDEKQLAAMERQVARVKALTPDARVPPKNLPLGLPVKYWLDLAATPPAAPLARDTRPVFVLQGESDYQVTRVDFAGWRAALDQHPRASFRLYPGLNHYFVPVNGPSTARDYETLGHVAEPVVADIADFVGRP